MFSYIHYPNLFFSYFSFCMQYLCASCCLLLTTVRQSNYVSIKLWALASATAPLSLLKEIFHIKYYHLSFIISFFFLIFLYFLTFHASSFSLRLLFLIFFSHCLIPHHHFSIYHLSFYIYTIFILQCSTHRLFNYIISPISPILSKFLIINRM